MQYNFTLSNGREVEVEVSYVMGMGGIGSYEFWGHRGSQSSVEIEDITFDFDESEFSAEELKEIEQKWEACFEDDALIQKIYDNYEASSVDREEYYREE